MTIQEGKRYTVGVGWIECLYGPTLTSGDTLEIFFANGSRVNGAIIKGDKKEIFIFDMSEIHEGSLIEEEE